MQRRFILTGCASGIGRHLTGALARQGHRIVATDVNLEGLEEAAHADGWDPGSVATLALDVSDPGGWQRVLDASTARFGDIDVLMNIAGVLEPGWVHALDHRAVHRHVDINVKGVIFGTRAAAERMVPRRSGHIVNIASMAALVPVPGLSVYSATKYAVRAFSLAAAMELRQHNVFVTTVCPDAVQTPMLDLQKGYDEAAMTFSRGGALTVADIERVIVRRVLPKRPLEVALPWGRGWLARLANMFSFLGVLLGPSYRRRGLEQLEKLRAQPPN